MSKSATAAVCRGCGAKLTVLQTVRGLCNDPECRRKDVAYQEDRIRESISHSWLTDAALAILPCNQQRLISLGRERIHAHRR